MRVLILVLCGSALAAQQAVGQGRGTDLTRADQAIEVAISDEALQLRYLTDADIVNVKEGRIVAGVFLGEDRDVVGSAALMVPIDVPLGRRLTVELGPQVYMALLSDDENSDVFSVSAGIQIRYDVVGRHRMDIVGSAFYSPDVLTFGSADNVTDLEARVELRLTERAIGMFGARWFELDLMDQTRTLQEELFAGVRWEFR